MSSSSPKKLRVVTYNIRKGLSAKPFERIIDALRRAEADLVLLQEAAGTPTASQAHEVARALDLKVAFAQTATTFRGPHGNAVLSRWSIHQERKRDLSTNPFEGRGLLHIETGSGFMIHVLCLHLNLLGAGRMAQLGSVVEHAGEHIAGTHPVILGGDFNDWQEKIDGILSQAELRDAYLLKHGVHARTYPSRWPLFRLDRLYVRHMKVKEASILSSQTWGRLSDHLPLLAELEFCPGHH